MDIGPARIYYELLFRCGSEGYLVPQQVKVMQRAAGGAEGGAEARAEGQRSEVMGGSKSSSGLTDSRQEVR